jgi:hypothetical protein
MNARGRRSWQRVPANLPIVLIAGDKRSGSPVLDLSRSGARLRFPWPLDPQTNVVLTSDRVSGLDARVVWREGDVGGVAFWPASSEVMAQIKLILEELAANVPRRPSAPHWPQFGRRMDLAGRRD